MIKYTKKQIEILIEIKNNSCAGISCHACPIRNCKKDRGSSMRNLLVGIFNSSKAEAKSILESIVCDTQKKT